MMDYELYRNELKTVAASKGGKPSDGNLKNDEQELKVINEIK